MISGRSIFGRLSGSTRKWCPRLPQIRDCNAVLIRRRFYDIDSCREFVCFVSNANFLCKLSIDYRFTQRGCRVYISKIWFTYPVFRSFCPTLKQLHEGSAYGRRQMGTPLVKPKFIHFDTVAVLCVQDSNSKTQLTSLLYRLQLAVSVSSAQIGRCLSSTSARERTAFTELGGLNGRRRLSGARSV